VKVDEAIAGAEANGQMVKDYLVALRANARQWSANTKGRSEISHSNKKPHPQKGKGLARQGSLAAPQYKGGGVVFGPKPKENFHIRVNKKERRAAIRSLLAEKIREQRVHIIEDLAMEAPKTKSVVSFLQACNLKQRVLFLGEAVYEHVEGVTAPVSVRCDKVQNFSRSVRNIPKAWFALACNVSGYDLAAVNDVVMTEAALTQITEQLK